MAKNKIFQKLMLSVAVLLLLSTCSFIYNTIGAQEVRNVNSPEGFVLVSEVIPDVIQEIRYFSTYNFVGRRIDSYRVPVAILTKEAASALKNAADDFRKQGYIIKIYDAYRPQTAVNHFKSWAQDLNDVKMKKYFYPNVNKSELFKRGYIASKSGHSRGSTIDMTLVDMNSGKEIDVGSPFDFFGEISHHDTQQITAKQRANRLIIKKTMIANGFKEYSEEWWHYSLKNEPYPQTYFDFPVELIP